MTHLDPQRAQAFWAGKVAPRDRQAILDHVAECERCLAVIDRHWEEIPGAHWPGELPEPGVEDLQRLEQSFFHRIHRMDLFAQAARLGFQGGLAVLTVLLKPINTRRRPTDKKEES